MVSAFLSVYKIFNACLPSKLFSKFVSHDYRTAINYLSMKYGFFNLSPEDFLSSAVSLALISGVLSCAILTYVLQVNLLSSLAFSILLFIATYFFTASYPLRIYQYERSIYSRYAYFVLKELNLVLLSTNSIFEAINFIKSGGYPLISRDFDEIIMNCVNGFTPEELLQEYALNQPSTTLRQGLMAIESTSEISASTLKIFSRFSSSEIRRIYKEQSVKMEMYCLLIIVLGLLFPFTYTFLLSYLGFSSSPLAFLMAPIQLFFLIITSKALLGRVAEPLG